MVVIFVRNPGDKREKIIAGAGVEPNGLKTAETVRRKSLYRCENYRFQFFQTQISWTVIYMIWNIHRTYIHLLKYVANLTSTQGVVHIKLKPCLKKAFLQGWKENSN